MSLFLTRLSRQAAAILLAAVPLLPQQSAPSSSAPSPTPPVVARRQPPPANASPGKPLELPPPQDFEKTIQILQSAAPGQIPDLPAPGALPLTSPPAMTPLPNVPSTNLPVPKNFHPNHDIALTAPGQAAVALHENWVNSSDPPSMGKDGRVLYTYGAGLPLIICEPLRITTIELQPGEKLTGEPQIADDVRWSFTPSLAGSGENAQTLILLKPKYSGLDTNLVLATDRRIYYLRLVSKPETYLARVAFTYPDEDRHTAWKRYQAEQQQQDAQRRQHNEADRQLQNDTNITLGYRFKGPHTYFYPRDAYDDGTFTYIQLPAAAKNYDAPALVIKGPNGLEPVEYDTKGTLYVVHRLFYKAALISGTGKHAKVVYITSPRSEVDPNTNSKVAKAERKPGA